VQQLVEGGLWLGLPAQSPAAHALTIAYLAFATVLWPIYVPTAVWMLEPSRARRKMILFSMATGAAISLFFLIPLITQPVWAEIKGAHFKYHLPHPHHHIAFVFYFVAVGIAPLLSSHRMVRLFGVALIVSSIAARMMYTMWFHSVWCFFAALMSGIVLLHFLSRRPPSINGSATRRA
jgi:hypothetical protein